MRHVANGYRGLELLVGLNADRLLFVLAIAGMLLAASYIGAP